MLLRAIHLIAAILIFILSFLYFKNSYQDVKEETKPQAAVFIDGDISAYELFCNINKHMNCDQAVISDEDVKDVPKIILMENTDASDIATIQNISAIAEQGSNLNIDFNIQDINSVLDSLYEEKLPDDIIDISEEKVEVVDIKNDKMKKLHILPARKPPYFGEKPVVVVVIDDMGISPKRTADIASLKAPITASFLTYGKKLDEQIKNSIESGHEIIIHVPMEAKKNLDVAPDVLTTNMSKEEIKENLLKMIKKFKDVKGINNHMGSKLTEDYERMKVVMDVLKGEGLYFLDSKTSSRSQAEKAAAASGIAYAHRHVFLDNQNDKNYILGQLGKAEKLARKNGYAIAIGHPKSQTYAALKEWLPLMEKQGVEIIPLSKAIKVLNPQYK